MLPINTQIGSNEYQGLVDYRFLCFEGEVKCLFVDIDTCATDGSHARGALRNVYDRNFKFINVKVTRNQFDSNLINKPKNFENMINYAEILSKPFPFCRVDLYNIEGRIFFGEMTFYHHGACNIIDPNEWDIKLGSWINIESQNIKLM